MLSKLLQGLTAFWNSVVSAGITRLAVGGARRGSMLLSRALANAATTYSEGRWICLIVVGILLVTALIIKMF